MVNFPPTLINLLEKRTAENAFRQLGETRELVDFSSNDYIGFAASTTISDRAVQLLHRQNRNGATGSRLLTGNHQLYTACETVIATFHDRESATLFNSGYDANIGLLSCVPQRNDIIFYDELCHASIRDGIKMSNAKAYKFNHNDLENLQQLLERHQSANTIYIVTESVFSMDGDSPDLIGLVELAEKFGGYVIVDEAHALGVFGENGEGLIQHLNLQQRVFACVMTFGKGLGCHGAAVLGSTQLRDYLVNFARSLIYTTALPPHSVATIHAAYTEIDLNKLALAKLRENISFFNIEKNRFGLKPLFVRSKSAIQSAIIPGNDNVKALAAELLQNGFDIRPILSPTVPSGQERLRICIHNYNTSEQISGVMETLATAFSRT